MKLDYVLSLLNNKYNNGIDYNKLLLRVINIIYDACRYDEYDFISKVAKHSINLNGKYLRPILCFIGASFGKFNDNILIGAAACELIHVATLYHDDVIDESSMRRGIITANKKWDNSIAILTGDFILARTSKMLSVYGHDIVYSYASTYENLVIGQIRELRLIDILKKSNNNDMSFLFDHYYTIIDLKTASLISFSIRLGAMLCDVDKDIIDKLGYYGRMLGYVFQIADDILDIIGTVEITGKESGRDILEHNSTLPILYAIKNNVISTDEFMNSTTNNVKDILDKLINSNVIQESIDQLLIYRKKAYSILEEIPGNNHLKDVLYKVVDITCQSVTKL